MVVLIRMCTLYGIPLLITANREFVLQALAPSEDLLEDRRYLSTRYVVPTCSRMIDASNGQIGRAPMGTSKWCAAAEPMAQMYSPRGNFEVGRAAEVQCTAVIATASMREADVSMQPAAHAHHDDQRRKDGFFWFCSGSQC